MSEYKKVATFSDLEAGVSQGIGNIEVEEIARVTARVYGNQLKELKRIRRGEENKAQSMAMYPCWSLGGATSTAKSVGSWG